MDIYKVTLTLIDLNLNDLLYYQFMIRLVRCNGSCNTLDNSSTKICLPNKTKDVNAKVFNMISEINEAKTLVKHTLCYFKFKFDNKTCKLNQKRNGDKFGYECKINYYIFKEDNTWNPINACWFDKNMSFINISNIALV